MTVIPFRRPNGTPPENEDPLYYLTLYPHSTLITDPNRDTVDKHAAAEALFDSTFHVLDDADDCLVLISLGGSRTQTFRRPDIFDTPEQRRWLARRLDDVYHTLSGRHRNPFRAFFNRLFPSKGDDQ